VGDAGEQNIQGKISKSLMFMLKFYSNIDKSLDVCGIASEENDEFITVEVTIATIINMWY
jgi:fructose-1,6-bisphosphatase